MSTTENTLPMSWTKAEQKRVARASHSYGYYKRGHKIMVTCKHCGTECEARKETVKELDAAILYHFEVECMQDAAILYHFEVECMQDGV